MSASEKTKPIPPGYAFNTGDMRRDWNARARQCAREYILTGYGERPEEDFEAEGRAQARYFSQFVAPESRILDLGCGVGRIALYLAPGVREYWGLDVSDEMLARARVRLAGLPNVRLLLGNGLDFTGVPEGALDFIFAYLTLHHVPREALLAYLRDGRRVLAEQGRFWLQVAYRQEAAPYQEPPDADTWMGRRYSVAELREICAPGYAWERHEVSRDGEFVWVLLRRA